MHPAFTTRRCSQGFSLVEVLISLLILSIGLLGLASLQSSGIRFNHTSYLRSQATVLAYDIADAMRANRGTTVLAGSALGGAYQTKFTDKPAGKAVAQSDLAHWKTLLATLLPEGQGEVTQNGNEFTISIKWTERGGTETPPFVMVTSL